MQNIISCLLYLTSASVDFTQTKIEKIRNYFTTTSVASNYTPEREFRMNMMQGNYQQCVQMLQQQTLQLTLEDFKSLQTLQMLEQEAEKKINAQACSLFLYHYLVEQKIITASKETLRGLEEVMQTAKDLEGVQGRFLKAIARDDTMIMFHLLGQGAQVDYTINGMKPIQFAIARGSRRALEFLHKNGAALTPEHLQSAQIYLELLNISKTERSRDITFVGVPQELGYMRAIDNAKFIETFIRTKLQPQEPTAEGR